MWGGDGLLVMCGRHTQPHVRQAHTARSRRPPACHRHPKPRHRPPKPRHVSVCLSRSWCRSSDVGLYGVHQVMWMLVLGRRLLWRRFGGAKLLLCFLPARPSYCFYSANSSTPPHKATPSSCECLYHHLLHDVNGFCEWCCNCCINSRNSMLAPLVFLQQLLHIIFLSLSHGTCTCQPPSELQCSPPPLYCPL